MKILLLFPMADGQTGPAIQKAFENLGHNVLAIDAKKHLGGIYSVARHWRPDLIFCSRTKELAVHIAHIKGDMVPGPKVCMWNVDTRANIDEWSHLFPLVRLCDYHFIVDTGIMSEWEKINPKTFCVHQGLQDDLYAKPYKVAVADVREYACDVSWAGNLDAPIHKFRKPFIKAVEGMGIKFKKWGCEGKPKLYGETFNIMTSLSRINLGLSAVPENGNNVSVRDYKIMGAGGFLLELYRKGIHNQFPADIFDHFNTPASLVLKIEHYLRQDRMRKDMAERGYYWVRANATYTHRIKEMLYIMKGDLKC